MHTRSWKIYGGLSLAVHGAVLGLMLLFGLDWLSLAPPSSTPLQVGFLSEVQVAAAVQSMANEGSAGGASSASEERQEHRVENAATQSLLPTIKAAAAPTAQEMERVVSPAVNALSSVPAAEVSAAQTAAPASYGADAGTAAGSGTAEDGVPSPAAGGRGAGAAAGLGDGFSDNGDGSYTAASSAGLSYRILRDAEAYYPEEARSLGYAATVSVTGRVLVGIDGSIESVRILTDAPNLGFRQAAEEAFWRMRFAPIVYQGYPIKLWFEKTLIFQP